MGSGCAKFALDRYLCVISESQVFGLRAGSGLAKMASNGQAVLGSGSTHHYFRIDSVGV